MATSVVWFRRDLRVHDHPALVAASDSGDRVAPLFVVDDRLVAGRWPAANRLWFMAATVERLAGDLEALGVPLTILRGDPRTVVPAFAQSIGAGRVVVSRDHSPYGRRRDDAVEATLSGVRIGWEAHPGTLAHEPEEVRRRDGGPFVVFGPFHRAWAVVERRPVLDPPGRLRSAPARGSPRRSIHDVLGTIRPTAAANLLPAAGESAARSRLRAWAASRQLIDYADGRDRLDLDATSHLSPDLRWGLLSPIEVLAACDRPGAGASRFASEIAWRDFYAHLLFELPRLAHESFRPEREPRWQAADARLVDAWRNGMTGYPAVDAAMRQLRTAGWMPNRARMIVASFLTKDLGIDWRIGERHFMEHLVDGDVASNNGGWQWAASTGTEPQPWFRIFNPVAQGRRHDPTGDYVRRWVPELADEPADAIHDTGARRGYPGPIVDHEGARALALRRRA